jgi:hypothetical protein
VATSPALDPLEADATAGATLCQLEHRLFRQLGEVLFRRDEANETPVMVVALGERLAAMPLRSLQRELDIADDSADGRMLGLVAQSLDFVNGLQIGDALPTEVLDGRASWTPGAAHRGVAAARLRLQLAAWLNPEAVGVSTSDRSTVLMLDEDPAVRQHVNEAMEKAARELGLDGREQVLGLLATLAEELSYIEALREGLFYRVRDTVGRIDRVFRAARVDQKRLEMITQVRRLAEIALKQIAARFERLDADSRDIMIALHNVDSQRNMIRSSRDGLYRTSRAWEPILVSWEGVAELDYPGLWHLIERSYRFLAPRYMPVQEWQAYVTGQHRSRPKRLGAVMSW